MADVIAARVRFSGSAFGTLTAIGVNNTLIGFMVAGIVGEFSAVVLVPLISSAAVSLANGLYWYWNSDYLYTANARAAAAAFSIFAFMVQEASYPFYNYIILENILFGRKRVLFRVVFWVILIAIAGMYILQIACTVAKILGASKDSGWSGIQVNYLSITTYALVVLVECLTAALLLQHFWEVLRETTLSPLGGGKLYRYIMRSTEIRLATIMLVYIGRMVTIAINTFGPHRGIVLDITRFLYTIQILFPIVLYLDVLASRLIFTDDSNRIRHTLIQDIEEPVQSMSTEIGPKAARQRIFVRQI